MFGLRTGVMALVIVNVVFRPTKAGHNHFGNRPTLLNTLTRCVGPAHPHRPRTAHGHSSMTPRLPHWLGLRRSSRSTQRAASSIR